MATQQEREAFLRGWRAAMEEVLAVLADETREYEEDEQTAATSGEYKLPGSFALKEVRGSLRGRHDLLAWLTQLNASKCDDPALARALDALIEDRATEQERAALGLTPLQDD
jgi:CRISPR/Cas system-associated endonuclease Cas3-HD